MMLYREVYGVEVRVVMRRLNMYYNNSNKKDLIKYKHYYTGKVMEWYKLNDWQAGWLVEHYMNVGYMYIMDEDIEAATKLGYIE